MTGKQIKPVFMGMVARLDWMVRNSGIEPAEIEKRAGLRRGKLREMRTYCSCGTTREVVSVASVLNGSIDWLIRDQGQPFLTETMDRGSRKPRAADC